MWLSSPIFIPLRLLSLQVHAGIKGVVFGFQGGEVAALPDAVIMVMNITDPTHPHLIDHAISTSKIKQLNTLILIIF